MRVLLSSHPRILFGFLITLLLILGSLMLARRILLGDSEETSSNRNQSTTHPSPPALSGLATPQSPDKEAISLPAKTDAPTPLQEAPIRIDANPSLLREPSPSQVKVRVLPPIQAEPDEEEVAELPPEVEPETTEEETAEETPPPPIPPEQPPDFVR